MIFFHKCLSVDPLVDFFIVPLSNWHPFNLLLFFLGFVFSLFSQLKNFPHPFSWQSDSALWCSAASWFFQVLQGRVSQIDISCGSVPRQLGDSPEVQCCVARQTVKKRRKSLWPGELTCSPEGQGGRMVVGVGGGVYGAKWHTSALTDVENIA